jgi:hypothetical protein
MNGSQEPPQDDTPASKPVQAVPRSGRLGQPDGSSQGWQNHSVPESRLRQERLHAADTVQSVQVQRPAAKVQSLWSGHMSVLPASKVAGHDDALPLHEGSGSLIAQPSGPQDAMVVQ